ncbi:flavin reductase family protein [Neobacillus sp. NRS-1170]|uniref:flavin reductase family protein n=1 Tax=Neobacillus sp. NRS-1170 TaxID=3233898 RepID=UPI003D2BAE34
MDSTKDNRNTVTTVEQNQYKHVIGHFTTGVSIITVTNNEIDFGITASAVSSVSVEPPMLLVCVNKNTGTCHAILESKSFTVNILTEDQKDLALQFAKAHTDKFKNADFRYGELGNPVFNQTLAYLECRVVEEVTGGTHSVFMAEVQTAHAATGEPLVYYRGKFGQFIENK